MYAWQATVQDEAGNVVPLPVVTVYRANGTTLASIFNESGAPLPNPLTGTMEGFVQFWANAGEYKIRGAKSGSQTEVWAVTIDAPAIRAEQAATAAANSASAAAGSASAAAASATAAAASGTPQYATLSAAQAASVYPGAVSIIVDGDIYVKDPTSNDLTTSGGVKWRKKSKPYAALFLGQSNMRGNTGATGGDQVAPSDSFVWNNYIPASGNGASTIGNRWIPAELGKYPSNQSGVNVLPFAIMRSIRKRSDRQIYGLTVAHGGYSIEAFLKPATLAANGWTRPSNHDDMTTQMYPQAAQALAAIPGSPTSFDAVYIHQGEYNMNYGDGVIDYRAKLAALYSDMLASGIVRPDTDIVFGGISTMNARWIDHAGAITNQLHGPIDGLKFASPKRVRLSDDNVHFSGPGIDTMGARMVDAAYSPLDKNSISESGDWTPVVKDQTGNTASGTFTGVWRRDGRRVFISADLLNINTTGLIGTEWVTVSGIPWSVGSDAFGQTYLSRVNATGPVSLFASTLTSNLTFTTSPSGASAGRIVVSDLTSGLSRIRFSLDYLTLQ